jgi:hypothetical protein
VTPKKITVPAARSNNGADTIESDASDEKILVMFCRNI